MSAATGAVPAPRHGWPAVAVLTAGASLLCMGFVTAVLQAMGRPGATASVLLLALGGAVLVALRPQWLIPAWVGLTWMSIGQHFFGGLPSPVQVGGSVFLVLGLALVVSERGRGAPRLLLGGQLAAAIALPAVAAALLSPEGAAVPKTTLADLVLMGAVALMVRSWADGERVAIALVIAGVVLGVGGAYSVLAHPTALFPLDGANAAKDIQADRAAGPFGESNFYALSLAVLVPFALHLAGRGGRWRPLGVVGVAALVAGVLASGSRGGLIAIGVALVGHAVWAGAAQSPSGGRSRLVAIVGVLCVVGLLPLFGRQVQGAQQRVTSGRATENRIAVEMWADHPVSGVGPQIYPVLYRDYARRVGDDPRPAREPHSLPLEILAEQGLAGVVGWSLVIGLLAGFIRRTGLTATALGRSIVMALLTYGCGSLFLHGSQQRLLFLLIGLVLAVGARAARGEGRSGRGRRSPVPRAA
ncbi:MAG: Lipid core--O-antigen ligase-like protein [Solirubrobacterales bacterium]|nr:Lipid core--O-antigen ligase-like protein [Solirubrobacterales bacterium]